MTKRFKSRKIQGYTQQKVRMSMKLEKEEWLKSKYRKIDNYLKRGFLSKNNLKYNKVYNSY